MDVSPQTRCQSCPACRWEGQYHMARCFTRASSLLPATCRLQPSRSRHRTALWDRTVFRRLCTAQCRRHLATRRCTATCRLRTARRRTGPRQPTAECRHSTNLHRICRLLMLQVFAGRTIPSCLACTFSRFLAVNTTLQCTVFSLR